MAFDSSVYNSLSTSCILIPFAMSVVMGWAVVVAALERRAALRRGIGLLVLRVMMVAQARAGLTDIKAQH